MLIAEQTRLSEEVIRTDSLERKLADTQFSLHSTLASLQDKELESNEARAKIIGEYVRVFFFILWQCAFQSLMHERKYLEFILSFSQIYGL